MRLYRSDWYFLNVFVRFLTILCLMSGVTMAARETRVFTRSHVVSHRSRRAERMHDAVTIDASARARGRRVDRACSAREPSARD